MRCYRCPQRPTVEIKELTKKVGNHIGLPRADYPKGKCVPQTYGKPTGEPLALRLNRLPERLAATEEAFGIIKSPYEGLR